MRLEHRQVPPSDDRQTTAKRLKNMITREPFINSVLAALARRLAAVGSLQAKNLTRQMTRSLNNAHVDSPGTGCALETSANGRQDDLNGRLARELKNAEKQKKVNAAYTLNSVPAKAVVLLVPSMKYNVI